MAGMTRATFDRTFRFEHSVIGTKARGMTDMVVGSGALLAEQRRPDATAEMNNALFSWKAEHRNPFFFDHRIASQRRRHMALVL